MRKRQVLPEYDHLKEGITHVLDIDSGIFLQLPDGSDRLILHPAKVVELKDDIGTVELEEEDLVVAVCQHVLIFYEDWHQFLQQTAYIKGIIQDRQKPTLEIKTLGAPVSAENRECYRVSAVSAGLTVELGAEHDCPLLDVSWSGFSVVAGKHYDIGSIVDAALRYEGEEYRGKVRVQSIRELSKGRIRYGLHCVQTERSANSMIQGLHRINISLQHEQLRHLAGTT